MATTVITGGRGFLGRQLAARILSEADTDADSGPAVDHLILADQLPPSGTPSADTSSARPPNPDRATTETGPRVRHLVGDVTDKGFLASIITEDVTRVFHLASVVSAGAEQNFDLGYGVNLLGTIALLERCRTVGSAAGTPIQVVFTSSLASYGSGAGSEQDGTVTDTTALRPETSYGVQKASCELLINDYHRKGFIDGRGLRLPTVTVRPGKPNKAASGFASGIIREPLHGIDAVCPVSEDTVMAVISPRRVIDALVKVSALEADVLGADRILLLPGLAMRMADVVSTLALVGAGRTLGRIEFQVDPAVQQIVSSWPPAIRAERAERLGFAGDASVAAIVRQHIEDELEG